MTNTVFDFEWMKRGGVFLAQDNQLPQHFAFFGMTCGIVVKRLINSQSAYSVGDWSIFASSYTPARMATRGECEAAGLEYIERPVSAEELAELHKDSERLAFLMEQRGEDAHFIDTYASGGMVNLGGGDWFKTPREAIDAATIKRSE